jgi:hypothetical protein
MGGAGIAKQASTPIDARFLNNGFEKYRQKYVIFQSVPLAAFLMRFDALCCRCSRARA